MKALPCCLAALTASLAACAAGCHAPCGPRAAHRGFCAPCAGAPEADLAPAARPARGLWSAYGGQRRIIARSGVYDPRLVEAACAAYAPGPRPHFLITPPQAAPLEAAAPDAPSPADAWQDEGFSPPTAPSRPEGAGDLPPDEALEAAAPSGDSAGNGSAAPETVEPDAASSQNLLAPPLPPAPAPEDAESASQLAEPPKPPLPPRNQLPMPGADSAEAKAPIAVPQQRDD